MIILIFKISYIIKMEVKKFFQFKNYKLYNKIGSGAFSEVFLAIKDKSDDAYAAKLEPVNSKHKLLEYEFKLLRYLAFVYF